METLKIGFGDTDAACFFQEFVDDMLDEMGDVDPEEIPVFSESMMWKIKSHWM
jgi:hypothetical protein